MHAPDGFLNAGTALATGALSAGAVGSSLRLTRERLEDRQIPLAGLTAAFVFATQMVNFPVAAGTTGHLLGGALAAILLGPGLGVLVVAVVVAIQALVFADGGLTALGYNMLNMAVVPAIGGFGVFRVLRMAFPRTRSGVAAAGGVAAGVSVVLAAAAFSIEWLFGATAPVPFDTVFGAMVGVHTAIGAGEGLITAVALGAVLAVRPDLVHGASDLTPDDLAAAPRPLRRTFVVAGLVISLAIAAVVSQFAADAPDGLERVAAEIGITGDDPLLTGVPFAEYATEGLRNETLSLAVAGIAGVLITAVVVVGGFYAILETRHRRSPAGTAG